MSGAGQQQGAMQQQPGMYGQQGMVVPQPGAYSQTGVGDTGPGGYAAGQGGPQPVYFLTDRPAGATAVLVPVNKQPTQIENLPPAKTPVRLAPGARVMRPGGTTTPAAEPEAEADEEADTGQETAGTTATAAAAAQIGGFRLSKLYARDDSDSDDDSSTSRSSSSDDDDDDSLGTAPSLAFHVAAHLYHHAVMDSDTESGYSTTSSLSHLLTCSESCSSASRASDTDDSSAYSFESDE